MRRTPGAVPWGILGGLISGAAFAGPAAPAGAYGQQPGGVRGQAEAVSGPVASSRWTIGDLLYQERAGSFDFSPDGRWIVWVRYRMDRKTNRIASNLWLTRVEDGESWALTRGSDANRAPRWSPDGRWIAFISDRQAPVGGGGEGEEEQAESSGGGGERPGPQLWILRLQGGDPWPLTRRARGLGAFVWKGSSSDSLVFVAREARSRFEIRRHNAKDDAVAVEDTLDSPPTRLWSVSMRGGVRRLTRNRDWIQALAVSPDGRRAVVRAGRSLSYQYDQKIPPRTFLVDLDSGRRRALDLPERTVPSGMEWARDGAGVYLSYPYSSHPIYRTATVTRVAYYDLEADRFVPVDLGWDRGLARSFQVTPGGFLASLADGVRDRVALYMRHGDTWRSRPLEGDHAGHLENWRVSRDARVIAYTTSNAHTPPQPYVARLDGTALGPPRRLARLNPGLAGKPMPRTEVVRWKGARGDQVEGILYYPLNYRPGRAYPVVVSPHGGPTSRDRDAWVQGWHDPYVLFNQKGAFVFRINYHGSCCYGLEWVESISDGRYYSLEIPDIEAGVDEFVRRGLFHPDSIVAAGWSNGAILSIALAVEDPERYRALIAGAGDVEWISDWANVDFGASFDNYYFGASPLEDPQRYIELSPYFRLDRMRAPTLIFFGTEDRNVPPSQGWNLYRALQQLGHTEVRFVLFPGEPHGPRKPPHQRRKVEEELRWLDRYLWGRPDTANRALDEGSPLASLVARGRAIRTGGLFGMRVAGVLAPETVTVPGAEAAGGSEGGPEPGRFEVTRAQWHEFDPAYVIEPGTENWPASGISFERARAYVRWLAKWTGQPYRLPSRTELEGWMKGASGGITLDYWAGYRPNPEDRGRLEAAIARLPGPAPLLREVGSYPGDGSGPAPHVYDLGGNVAEWAVDGSGAGVSLGASAERPRCDGSTTGGAAAAYRGLRVVKGG